MKLPPKEMRFMAETDEAFIKISKECFSFLQKSGFYVVDLTYGNWSEDNNTNYQDIITMRK